MGKSEQRELANRMAVLLAHLLKRQLQPGRCGVRASVIVSATADDETSPYFGSRRQLFAAASIEASDCWHRDADLRPMAGTMINSMRPIEGQVCGVELGRRFWRVGAAL